MSQQIAAEMTHSIENFHLPRYQEIPDMGLFLDQTAKFISSALQPLDGISITGSMISNYVKRKLIANPVKKLYSREQIAYLIFITVAKNVLSLEHLQLMFRLQQETYPPQVAYDYFCQEFENILAYAFGLKEELDEVGVSNGEIKTMLRNTIIAVSYKIYLEKYLVLTQNSLNQD